jgi:hypothetical protein
MARNVAFHLANDFTGGLNFRADQFQLAPNESPFMKNVEIDPRGGVFSRAGYEMKHTTKISTAATWRPKGLFNYQGSNPTIVTSTSYVSTSDYGRVFTSTGGNFSQLNISGQNINVVNTDGASFTQFDEIMYFVVGNASNQATPSAVYSSFKYSAGDTYATTLTASGPTWQAYELPVGGYFPKANICKVHANKMFVANTYENGEHYPNRLRWSHEGLPEDWYDDDYIDITAGGNGIRGMCIVDGQLLIFKPKAVYLLMGYDADNFQLVEISTIHGIDYPQQACEGDGGVYFFDYPKGLFFYNRNGVQDIFNRLKPIITDQKIATGYLDTITTSFVNNRLWLSMPFQILPTDSSPTFATVNFIFDQSIGQFGAYTMFQSSNGYGLLSGTDWRDGQDNSFHLMSRADVPFVCYVDDFDNTTDEEFIDPNIVDADFATNYTTPFFDDNRYVQTKTFTGPSFVMKDVSAQTQIKVNVYADYNSSVITRAQTIDILPEIQGGVFGTGLFGTAVFGLDTVATTIEQGSRLGRAQAIQLEFIGPNALDTDTLGRKWGLNSIGYKFKRRNIKG